MPIDVTVLGAHGTVVALPFLSTEQAAVAQSLANTINAGVLGGTLAPVDAVGIVPPTLPAGVSGELVVQHGGPQLLSPGYKAVVVKALSVSLLGDGETNQSVLAGTGGLTYITNGGFGSIVAAGGANTIVTSVPSVSSAGGVAPPNGPGWYVQTGAGDDTISSKTGNDTISAGAGHNLLILGSGQNLVDVSGHDFVQAGAGADTIAVRASATALIDGGSGNLVVFGENSASTILGAGGSVTLFGGGAGYYSGGLSGHNALQGSGTLVAAGDANTLFGGTGDDTLVAGAATDSMAGAFNTTMFGGAGVDIFEFIKATGGSSDLVRGFGGADSVQLSGYTAADIASTTTGPTGTTIKLTDNTTITFQGVTNASSIHITFT